MKTSVLDHGYVQLVETWGSDERVVEAARMSTGKGFLGWGAGEADTKKRIVRFKETTGALYGGVNHPDRCECQGNEDTPHTHYGDASFACARCSCTTYRPVVPGTDDEKLLRYLYENKHDTPFEMAGMVIEVQAPIFVFREWHRHRTQSYNEMSARYTPLPDLNYVPTVERLLMNGGANKQAGSTGAELSELGAEGFQRALERMYKRDEEEYQAALACGVPKELARLVLPVGRYSRMRASANLRNWLAFLTLRAAPNAQWEIQQYARAVGAMVAQSFPRTWALFEEGKRK
jgi:thymidylate synthase (FAD)